MYGTFNGTVSSSDYKAVFDILNLTFRGPCIVIYSYNKNNEKH